MYWSFVRGSFGAGCGKKKSIIRSKACGSCYDLVSALAILAQISEEMESGGIELELVRHHMGKGIMRKK